MKRLQSEKLCAALVIIAFLASLVSIWGLQDAGRRAVASSEDCTPKDLQGLGLQLEMARTPEKAREILNGPPGSDSNRFACLRRGMAAQVRADYLFIPAYSGLTLTLFLFLRALWIAPPRERRAVGRGLLALGLLLTLGMITGDVFENRQLTSLIDHAERSLPLPKARLDALCAFGALKWGSLAASALVLAVLWRSESSPRLVWVLRLLGLAAAAFLLVGLVRSHAPTVDAGFLPLAAFWLAALIHAIAVAAKPEPLSSVSSRAGVTTP